MSVLILWPGGGQKSSSSPGKARGHLNLSPGQKGAEMNLTRSAFGATLPVRKADPGEPLGSLGGGARPGWR